MLNRLLETPARSPPTKYPVPVTCLQEYKSLTRGSLGQTTHSKAGTLGVANLANKVLKECQNNQKLLNLFSKAQKGPESTSGHKSKKKARIRHSRENRSPGTRTNRWKTASKAKKKRRSPSESSCSSNTKSSSESDRESNTSSSS